MLSKSLQPSDVSRRGRAKPAQRPSKNGLGTWSLPPADLSRQIEEYFIALDTAVSLSMLILYRHKQFDDLVSKEIDPRDYIDVNRFEDDFAAVSFLRKSEFLKTTFDRKSIALDGFRTSETVCSEVNRRLSNPLSDPLYTDLNGSLHSALTFKIGTILGEFDVPAFFDGCSWGPGVTTLVKGSETSATRKFHEERGITKDCYHLVFDAARAAYPSWMGNLRCTDLVFEPGNTVITVPKDARRDRTIAVEPGLNLWFQKGLGSLIRSRLRRAGFDLNSDAKNHNGARKGAADGSLATVDFSAASDTISAQLVESILPARWFHVADALRSHNYMLDGKWHRSQKFSSMGNGFTFELESLIFVSAALVVCKHLQLPVDEVSVFGDDIIIPVEAYDLYSKFCQYLGFTVNSRKSFSDGNFRESCGCFYFGNRSVKPLFLKKNISSLGQQFTFINGIRRIAHSRLLVGCDARFLPLWKYCVRAIPAALRLAGPAEHGDVAIHQNIDECTPSRCRHGIDGWVFSALRATPARVSRAHEGLLYSRLLQVGSTDRASLNEDALRGVTTYRIHRAWAAQWYDFGPWY